MRRLGVLALAGGIASAGCSLVKLSDDIEIGVCDDNDDCDVLNDHADPDFDPCFLWQCDETSGRCEMSALDDDNDGFTPSTVVEGDETVTCEPPGEPDCSDETDRRAPDLPESCDNVDNDCDGRIDEGKLTTTSRSVVTFQEAHSGGPIAVAYAVDHESGNIDVAYAINEGMGIPAVTVVPADLADLQNATPLKPATLSADSLRGGHVGVAAMNGQALALALVNVSGVTRTMVGLSEGTAAPSDISYDPGMAKYGLACHEDEDCAPNADGLTCLDAMECTPDEEERDPPLPVAPTAIDAPATFGVALASLGDRALVTYLRGNADSDPACTEGSAAPWLLASLVRQRRGSFVEVDLTSGPIDLGDSADAAPAAALGVPPIELEEGTQDVGFVVARVQDDGKLALERLWEDGGLQHETLVTLGNAPASQASLALGPRRTGTQQLGVAHTRGCGLESRIVVHLVELSVDEEGTLHAERLGRVITLHDGASQSEPSIAYNAARKLWAVSYTDPRGVRARLVEPDGAVRNPDDAPYYLVHREVGTLEATLQPFLTSGTRGDTWFTALSPMKRNGTEHSIDAIELVCSE